MRGRPIADTRSVADMDMLMLMLMLMAWPAPGTSSVERASLRRDLCARDARVDIWARMAILLIMYITLGSCGLALGRAHWET